MIRHPDVRIPLELPDLVLARLQHLRRSGGGEMADAPLQEVEVGVEEEEVLVDALSGEDLVECFLLVGVEGVVEALAGLDVVGGEVLQGPDVGGGFEPEVVAE